MKFVLARAALTCANWCALFGKFLELFLISRVRLHFYEINKQAVAESMMALCMAVISRCKRE